MRAIFLDVDDTLVDYDTAARGSFYATLGADASYEAFRNLEHYERFLDGTLDFAAMREQRMADFLAAAGRSDDPVELERQRFEGLTARYRLFDDALPCIEALRSKGMLLGLITNNESAHQRAKIAAVGLDGLFDVVVISGEVGIAKPHPAIFEHACAALGVGASEAMHVGDDLRADAEGATAAGLRGVWLDRRRKHDGASTAFDVVGSLAQVPHLVA